MRQVSSIKMINRWIRQHSKEEKQDRSTVEYGIWTFKFNSLYWRLINANCTGCFDLHIKKKRKMLYKVCLAVNKYYMCIIYTVTQFLFTIWLLLAEHFKTKDLSNRSNFTSARRIKNVILSKLSKILQNYCYTVINLLCTIIINFIYNTLYILYTVIINFIVHWYQAFWRK